MRPENLIDALSELTSKELAKDLVGDYQKVRTDYITGTLERSSPGKFVESYVQALQFIASGKYDPKPNVDKYLSDTVVSLAQVPEGLRICGARLARSVYALRNKRSIAHKNPVDPSNADLFLAHQAIVWILSELVRNSNSLKMDEAKSLIESLNTPIGFIVEEIDGDRLVHRGGSVREEILLLLHSYYPKRVSSGRICADLHNRKEGSITARLAEMKQGNIVHLNDDNEYKLSQIGYRAAVELIQKLDG